MNRTSFLSNETLWQTLSAKLKAARHVDAAFAYFGSGGAKLLPLKRGSRLVVNMSLASLRAGATNPHEIEKLIRKGVQVFSRRNLHAKMMVIDRAAIIGSANISGHARHTLDEAAVLTTDQATVRRAKDFIERLLTEPVSPEYLEKCKRLYRPPRFAPQGSGRKTRERRVQHAKLWVLNLREGDLPEAERARLEKGEAKAEQKIRDKAECEVNSCWWSVKPKMASELEPGDRIIRILRQKDGQIMVYPPGAYLEANHWVRRTRPRRERWVFHIEIPVRGQPIPWGRFRQTAASVLSLRRQASPRTTPVRDGAAADHLLNLWTPAGYKKQKRR